MGTGKPRPARVGSNAGRRSLGVALSLGVIGAVACRGHDGGTAGGGEDGVSATTGDGDGRGDQPGDGGGDRATTPGGWRDASYSGPEGSRSYRLYVPATTGTPAARPLVLLLHGCSQTAADVAAATRIDELAERRQLLVVAPTQPSTANPQGCWSWYVPENQGRAGEAALLAAIAAHVAATEAIDAGRVYVAGFSAGGAMAAILASCYVDRFAAAAIHSGLMFEAATDAMSAFAAMGSGTTRDPAVAAADAAECAGTSAGVVPVLVIHGRADTVVDVANADATVAESLAVADRADDGADNGSVSRTPATTTSFTAAGGLSYEVARYGAARAVERVLVTGLGHAWSGGPAGGSYTDPNGPDATSMVWDFFAAHAR
ncbi:MAG: PHB depolymerase family esterase [Deltaproteobacteria bacterium]|nr:PHB depolymerase family esterase [Deltaproteobacteria bacterium]